MKKLLLFASLSVLFLSSAWSQVKEQTATMSQGSNNCLIVDLPGAKAEDARSSWEKFSKDFDGKTKFDKKTGEVFTDNAVIKEINGNNTIDIFASFRQVGPDVQLSVWFNLGGAYLNSAEHKLQFASAESIMRRFLISFSKAKQEEVVKVEKKKAEELQDQLKDLVKDKGNIEKDNGSLAKDIEEYKKKIAEAEKRIEENKKKLEENLNNQRVKQDEVDKQVQKVKAEEKTLEEIK